MDRSSSLTGADFIKNYVKSLPSSPGVYRMLDAKGQVLYVGKARNLKNRVGSYAQARGQNNRITKMVSLTVAMEFITTHTEAEALLLEANLIKKLSPRYNILLRDDKSFPFILVAHDHAYPRIEKHRGAQKAKGKYYGPFASVLAVNETLAFLQKAFLLRPCADTVFSGRTRPCLQYQIKRCSAPCVGKISEKDYAKLVQQAEDFLSGKSRAIQEQLAAEMEDASARMDYEQAAGLRDRIRALTRVQDEQRLSYPGLSDADVIALHREGDRSCVQVFFFRAGQNFGNRSFYPSHSTDATESDILEAFIGQFYQIHAPAKLILTSVALEHEALLAEALTIHAAHKVEISYPQRGDRKQAMEQALKNAALALRQHLAERASQQHYLQQVAELFGMDEAPKRIEIYDNSHLMGTNAVGAMVVAGPEGFIKKAYRRFTIRREGPSTGGDDYAMLREVLTRRFQRLIEEDKNDDTSQTPDLILVDGGAAHLKIAEDVFTELGVQGITLVCVAKGVDRNAGREWFHPSGKEAFQLPLNTPVLHFLQRLRDEAHRFAIGSHRIKRQNSIRQSELDDIPGIGPARKKALLVHFGSAKAVRDASLAELETVPGVNKKTAETIHHYFHS